MTNLNSNILILFGVSAVAAFFWPFFRDGVMKQLSIKSLIASVVPFILSMLPFAALFGLAAYLQIDVSASAPAFAGSAILGFVLNRIGLPPALRGVLLVSAAVAMTTLIPQTAVVAVTAASMLGLLSAKLIDNLMFADLPSYDDVVAPLAWLGGFLWLTMQQTTDGVMKEGVLLGAISVCFLLRFVQRPFMTDDRWLLKRSILAATGGLGVLMVMTKILLQTEVWNLALLVGAGMFCSYLFQNVDIEGEDKVTASVGIQQLIVIGVLTLVANRFFGAWGMLMLIPAALLPLRGGFATYAGLFFLSRIMLQGFVQEYNANVTGINLVHAYTGAALYAGFIVMGILFMLLREMTDGRARAAVFLGSAVLVPVAAVFYLHAEPSSSLLVAATVAGVMFAAMGPALQRNETTVGFGNLLLVPTTMSVAGITFGGLIDAGIAATNETRLIIIGVAVVLAAIAAVIGWITGRKVNKPVEQTASPL